VITVTASTVNPQTGLVVESNPIKFYLNIPESQKGVYTLPTSESTEGATLDSAVYLTIDRFGAVQFLFDVVTATTTSTTTTTTTAALITFQDDEFNDASIDPIWIQDQGATGGIAEAGTQLTLTSSEENVFYGGAADFHWLYQNGIGGDFDIAVKLDSLGSFTTNEQGCGIVAWIDDSNWATIGRYQKFGDTIRTCHRVAGSYKETYTSHTTEPVWLRVKRVGSTFSTWYSDNGSSWTPYDPVAGVLSGTGNVRIGLHANDQFTAQFTVLFDRIYNV